MENLKFKEAYKTVCENLGIIYEILHEKDAPDIPELNKTVSELYNVLNHIENKLNED